MRSFSHVVEGIYRHGVVTLWTHFRSSVSYISESVGDDLCICSFSLWLWVFPPDECVSIWGRKMNAEALFVVFCAFAEKISNNYTCDEWKSLCLPTDFQMHAGRKTPSCRFWLWWWWWWFWCHHHIQVLQIKVRTPDGLCVCVVIGLCVFTKYVYMSCKQLNLKKNQLYSCTE